MCEKYVTKCNVCFIYYFPTCVCKNQDSGSSLVGASEWQCGVDMYELDNAGLGIGF